MDEVKTAKLGDKRLNARLGQVLSQLAARPTASIPAACGGRAEMVAAYRFCENENTGFDSVLQSHIDATRERMAAQPVALLVQDTSEIDVTRPGQPVAGAGPLDGDSRRGALLHLMHAFTPDGTPLGQRVWNRVDTRRGTCLRLVVACRAGCHSHRREGEPSLGRYAPASDEEARRCPATQLICVADSEADIYEVLVEGTREPRRCDWIVRACQDRALLCEKGENSGEKHVREYVLEQPVLFDKTIQVRGRKAKVACETRGRRQPRQSREAEVVVRVACVTLRPPWRAGP